MTATRNVQAQYIQKSILIVVSSQSPVRGTPYLWMLLMIVAIESQNVANVRDSDA